MDFLVEQTDFPSAVHQIIYSSARGLAPLARSLPAIESDTMRASCEALRGFFVDMLSDMYDSPDAYHLPVLVLETFCGFKKVNGVKQKHPAKVKNLLAQTRNAVAGYIGLLYWLGRLGTVRGDKLLIPENAFVPLAKHAKTTVSPIPLEHRLAALERVGLMRRDSHFISRNHPAMFPALCAMAAKADKQSGFDYFAFRTADFRNLVPDYHPSHEDYFQPLPGAQRKIAFTLHDIALSHSLVPNINTFWKVDYKYKGVQVMCIGTDGWDDHARLLDVRVVGTYGWEDPALINDRLSKEPPPFQRSVLRHVWRCNACATTHLGQFVYVLGKRQRVCGGGQIGFRWYDPRPSDLPVIERLIEMRCEIIDELKAQKKAK